MATLTRVDGQVELPEILPVVALRDLVFFPYMVLPLLIGRPRSLAALEEAREAGDDLLLLLAQREADVDEPDADDLYRVGTVVRVVQASPLADGTNRVVLEGLGRVRVLELLDEEDCFRASPIPLVDQERDVGTSYGPEEEATIRRVERLYEDYVRLHDQLPDELMATLSGTGDRVRKAHLMAGHLLVRAPDKQKLLEATTVLEMHGALLPLLEREMEILRIEEKIDLQVQRQVDSDRRQHYLQEQLKAIQSELGAPPGELQEVEESLRRAELPDHARERAERELDRLKQLNPVAPEAAVIRGYLEWILALPWSHRTPDDPDVEHARRVLDDAHYGLEEVKERILDHMAVLSVVGEIRGPILCLVGPPGVGKTSLGKSVARALGRSFVRASLGGLRDEAEIRGHRRTYVGALPGRILQGMRRGGSRNPVFLLDEVDKLARDFHGDPAAALLEVLDPEQNRGFTDHYLELEFDLSDVLFIATANTLVGIPEPLRDRMEVIRLPGYLDTEKKAIAKSFLWPKQLRRHGLDDLEIRLDEEAVDLVIERYTREAGVRELDRQVSRLARKLTRQRADGSLLTDQEIRIGPGDLRGPLGPAPYTGPEREEEVDRTGIANGLAWTAVGGQILDVEVAAVPGKGEIELTGTLGDVMKESAVAALTYARSRADVLDLDPAFHKNLDLHIHIPEGATPKDGPSAGITIAVALISALTGIPTRPDVALTGEITLRGRVLGVGGIKEKAVAALRSGITTVLLPDANASDLELLPQQVRERVSFVRVKTMDEVLEAALARRPWRSAGPTPGLVGEAAESGMHLSQ